MEIVKEAEPTKDTEYYIYVNAFWYGFINNTDANTIAIFEKIFSKTFMRNFKITDNLNIANVLFESVFGSTLADIINRPKITKIPEKFCCFIVSNDACNTRNKMFHLLNSYKKVDSGGKYCNNINYVIRHNYWSDEFRAFISNYKFIICFENHRLGTYSTEKIVNPYIAGSIPIYWSSKHIHKVFNRNSMYQSPHI